jgi:hypothetical protein
MPLLLLLLLLLVEVLRGLWLWLRLTLHVLLVVRLRRRRRLVVVMLLLLRRRRATAVIVGVPAAAVPDARRVPGPWIHRNDERSNRGEIRLADRSGPKTTTRQDESGVGCWNWEIFRAVSVGFASFGEFVAWAGGGGGGGGWIGSVAEVLQSNLGQWRTGTIRVGKLQNGPSLFLRRYGSPARSWWEVELHYETIQIGTLPFKKNRYIAIPSGHEFSNLICAY